MKQLSYLNAAIAKPIGRGANVFSPAFAAVPLSAYNGSAFRAPRAAPALQNTAFTLMQLGMAAGFPYQAPGTMPLAYNPYTATSESIA